MALNVGELVAFLRADNSGFRRGVRESRRDLEGLQRDANGRLRDMRGRYVAEGRAAGEGLGNGVDRGSRGGLSKLTARLGALGGLLKKVGALAGKGLQMSVLAAGAASGAASVVHLLAALGPLVGLLAALPAAIGVAGAALITLHVAMSGVSEAFSAAASGDTKKFEESLKKLSPAARSVAREFKTVVPQLQGIKRAAQNALFGPLQGEIRAVAANLSGPLKTGMAGVAGAFGAGAKQAALFAREGKTAAAVSTLLASAKSAVQGATTGIRPLLSGLRDVAASVAPVFDRLGGAIGSVATRFGNWLSKVAANGQALKWVNDAVAVLKQLGAVGGNVVGIVKSIFQAAAAGGGSALGVMGELLGKVNQFLKSAEGQSALVAIFTALGQVGNALMPIFTALGPAVAGIAPHIAAIATALGPGIAAAVSALGPALAALGPGLAAVAGGLATGLKAMGPALLPLGKALGQILVAAAPLLPMFGQLLGALGPLFAPIGLLVSSLISGLLPAIKPLIPIITKMAALLATNLTKGVKELLPAILPLIPVLSQFLEKVGTQLLDAMTKNAPVIMDVGKSLIQLLPAILPLIVSIGELVLAVLPLMIQFVHFEQVIYSKVIPVLVFLIKIVAKVASVIISAFAGAIRWLTGAVPAAWHAVSRAWSSGMDGVIRLTKSLGSKVKGAVGNLGGLLVSAGNAVIQGLWNGISGAAGWLKSKLIALVHNIIPGPVRKALGIASPSKVMRTIGYQIMQGLHSGLTGSAAKIQSTSTRIANLIHKAFAGRKTRVDDRLIALVGKDNKKLKALAGQRDAILQKIADAKKYAAQIADNAKTFAAITNLDTPEGGSTADSIISGLGSRLAAIRSFASNIAKLTKQGLSKTALKQILDAGPEAGAAIAQTLVASGQGTVKQVNALQAQIDKAAAGLGNNGADALYDAGKNAGKGLLAGLKSQEAAIVKQMNKITASLVKAIKKALKIHSPSQVTMALGVQTGAGYALGLRQQIAAISRAAGGAGRAAEAPLRRTAAAASSSSTAQLAGGRTAAVKGGDGAALAIENYYEAPRGSARGTAEELLMLTQARG